MSHLLGRLKDLWRREGGASAVEFALVAPLFFLFLFGVIEFGRLSWIRSSLQYAADQASRYALTNSTASSDQISAQARSNVSGVDPNLVTVTVTQEASGGRTFVVIDLSYGFTFHVPMWPAGPLTLAGRSRVPTG